LAIAIALAGPVRAGVESYDPSLPDREARRHEQLETERLGFLAARAQRPAEESAPAARSDENPLLADGSNAAIDASSKLRGGLAKKAPDAAGPSSLEFWFTGPMPPWILLVGLLMGLSFLTAAWVLHLRSGGKKAETRSAGERVQASAQRASEANQALAQRLLARLSTPAVEAQRRSPLASARPEPVAAAPRAELPRRFARFTTIDEAPAPTEQELPAILGANSTVTANEPDYVTGRAADYATAGAASSEPIHDPTYESTPIPAPRHAVPVAEYEPVGLYAEEFGEAYDDFIEPSIEEPAYIESEPEVVPPIRVLSSSVLSHGVPVPPRAERERAELAAPLPTSAALRSEEDRRRPKLARRVSLLERSTLELLTNVDRLAGKVEQLTDAVRNAPPAKPTLKPKSTPMQGRAQAQAQAPAQSQARAQSQAQAPTVRESVELGPWSDPNVALPPNRRAIHPEPFFARLAAQRARERSPESASTVVGKLASAPKLVTTGAPSAPQQRPATARASEPSPAAMNAPALRPGAGKANVPEPETSPLPQRMADAARVRQVVLKLAREGWDAPRIAREGRIPVRDVHLILKSAGRETGTADLKAPRR